MSTYKYLKKGMKHFNTCSFCVIVKQRILEGIQMLWPWHPMGRLVMIDYLKTPGLKQRKFDHKVVRFVWDFDDLHFAQYILISVHGTNCKQFWYKKINGINSPSCFVCLREYECIICVCRFCLQVRQGVGIVTVHDRILQDPVGGT